MKIFVISLVDSAARRRSAASQMAKAGLEFEFFDGVQAETALDDHFDGYDEYWFLRNTGRTVAAGEIGCYASHLELWRKCVELDEPIVIMEDDFQLIGAFTDSIRVLAQNISQFGFIRLQTETRARKRRVKTDGNFVLSRYTKVPQCLNCYGIAPGAAKALVETSRTLTAPVDVHVKKYWEHGQRIYGLTPYTVSDLPEVSHDSNIKGRKKAKKSLWMKVLRPITKCQWYVRKLRFDLLQEPVAPDNISVGI